MTTDVVTRPIPRTGRPLMTSVAVVAALIVVEILLQHEMPELERWVATRVDETSAVDAWGLLFTVLRWAVLAACLVCWGLTPRRRLIGAVVALSGGVVEWGLNEIFFRWVYATGHASEGALRAYSWALILLMPTIAALAWGLARRRGRRWPIGLALAPLLAWGYQRLWLHGSGFTSWVDGTAWWLRALVLLAPAVVGGIACWLVERHELGA